MAAVQRRDATSVAASVRAARARGRAAAPGRAERAPSSGDPQTRRRPAPPRRKRRPRRPRGGGRGPRTRRRPRCPRDASPPRFRPRGRTRRTARRAPPRISPSPRRAFSAFSAYPPRIPARPRASRPRASRTPSRRPRPRRHTSRLRRGARGGKRRSPQTEGHPLGPRVAEVPSYAASRDVAPNLRRRGFPLASPRMRAPSSSRSSRLNAGSTSASRGDRRARAPPTSRRCAGLRSVSDAAAALPARAAALPSAPRRRAPASERSASRYTAKSAAAPLSASIEAASVAPTPTVARARRASSGTRAENARSALACDATARSREASARRNDLTSGCCHSENRGRWDMPPDATPGASEVRTGAPLALIRHRVDSRELPRFKSWVRGRATMDPSFRNRAMGERRRF